MTDLADIGRELRALHDGFRELRDPVAENTATAVRIAQVLPPPRQESNPPPCSVCVFAILCWVAALVVAVISPEVLGSWD